MNRSDFALLNKGQLNEVLKQARGAGVDVARASKDSLIDLIMLENEEKVLNAMPQMLVAGAMGVARSNVINLPTFEPEPIPTIEVIGTASASQAFGIRSKWLAPIQVDLWNDPAAPEVDTKYRFDPEQLSDTLLAINAGRNVWLGGPAGTGKTEYVKNICAYLGRAFVRVSFDSGAERYEYIGGERMKNGTTFYQQGAILLGMTRPGAIVLLDEVGFARPEYLSACHPILEPAGVVTVAETGQVFRKAKGVVFFAADNSNGRGDSTGMYQGVREMNLAFMDRFSLIEKFTYLAPAVESKVISDRSGCTVQLGELIVKFLTVCRAQADGAALMHPPTLRQAFYLAEMLTGGSHPKRAFEKTIVNRSDEESQEVLRQAWKANVSNNQIKDALAGKSVVAPILETQEEPATEIPF